MNPLIFWSEISKSPSDCRGASVCRKKVPFAREAGNCNPFFDPALPGQKILLSAQVCGLSVMPTNRARRADVRRKSHFSDFFDGLKPLGLPRGFWFVSLIFRAWLYFFFSIIEMKFRYFPPPASMVFLSPTAYSLSCFSQSSQTSSLLSISLIETISAFWHWLTMFLQ